MTRRRSRNGAPRPDRLWPHVSLQPYTDRRIASFRMSTGYAETMVRINITQPDAVAMIAELERFLQPTEPIRLAVPASKVHPDVINYLTTPEPPNLRLLPSKMAAVA